MGRLDKNQFGVRLSWPLVCCLNFTLCPPKDWTPCHDRGSRSYSSTTTISVSNFGETEVVLEPLLQTTAQYQRIYCLPVPGPLYLLHLLFGSSTNHNARRPSFFLCFC